jgi:hypothetical protein
MELQAIACHGSSKTTLSVFLHYKASMGKAWTKNKASG